MFANTANFVFLGWEKHRRQKSHALAETFSHMSRSVTSHSDDRIESGPSDNGNAEIVFRIRKAYRNLSLVCLALFFFVGIGAVYGMWIGAPPDLRTYAVVSVSLIWSAMTGLAAWGLLSYWRKSLTIQNAHVIWQGVLGRKEIDLASVREARWRLAMSGSIKLRSLSDHLTIHLDSFGPIDRLWLIRYFRITLPESVQDGWDTFCYEIVLPLRDQVSDGVRSPGPEEV